MDIGSDLNQVQFVLGAVLHHLHYFCARFLHKGTAFRGGIN